jgi:hypothetical protein
MMVDEVDDIIDDLVAFNYARTGKISLTPCAPIEECSECGSILEESESGSMNCPDCAEQDEFWKDEDLGENEGFNGLDELDEREDDESNDY